MFTTETWRVSIADSCTFHLNLMCRIDQSLAVGFIPINTRQQRASLPFKPGVVESKVYNNDGKTFFSVITFASPRVIMCLAKRYYMKKNVLSSYFWAPIKYGKMFIFVWIFINLSTYPLRLDVYFCIMYLSRMVRCLLLYETSLMCFYLLK